MNKALYVGLDVHKDTIAVAVAEDGRSGEIRFHGAIVNSADAVLRLTKTLTKNGHIPSFCYEAAPDANRSTADGNGTGEKAYHDRVKQGIGKRGRH